MAPLLERSKSDPAPLQSDQAFLSLSVLAEVDILPNSDSTHDRE